MLSYFFSSNKVKVKCCNCNKEFNIDKNKVLSIHINNACSTACIYDSINKKIKSNKKIDNL